MKNIECDIDELDDSEYEDLSGRNNDDNSIMFEAFDSVGLRQFAFNLSYEVRKAIVNLIKCLIGPLCETWSMNKYALQKKYDPSESVLIYTFFCKSCKAPLLGPISKVENICAELYAIYSMNPVIFRPTKHIWSTFRKSRNSNSVRGVKVHAILLQLSQFNAVWGFPYAQ